MIIVTGTKRSGTSMWMQVLRAGGIPTIGEQFSGKWKESILGANRRGFFESWYRRGVFYQTNPHPLSGQFLRAEETECVGLKVFIPGLVRTELSYLYRVIATVRPFRQYVASLTRLYDMERESQQQSQREPRPHLDPVLEWWLENYLLIRDIATRGYQARLVAYDTMLSNPDKLCAEIFNWLEVGDEVAAARAVHPEDRTQTADAAPPLTHAHEEVFDDFYRRVQVGLGFDATFLTKMNETHIALLPEIEAALDAVATSLVERKKRGLDAGIPGSPLDVDRLEMLLHAPRRQGHWGEPGARR